MHRENGRRQNRERATVSKPACSMRRIAQPRHHTGLLAEGNGAARGTASVKRHPKLVPRRHPKLVPQVCNDLSCLGCRAGQCGRRQGKGMEPPMRTDGPSPARPFTATVERPILASGAGAVAPVPSVCIGGSKFLLRREPLDAASEDTHPRSALARIPCTYSGRRPVCPGLQRGGRTPCTRSNCPIRAAHRLAPERT
jgi:hypothetical protein